MKKILHNIKSLFRKDRKKAIAIMLLAILIFSFTAAVILNLPKKVKGAWFNDSWAYRQTSLITNSGSAQTNYNLKLTVDTATLVTASKMQSDCDDIRVTDETGNLLKFWIEPTTCNTSATIVWLKVPSVVVGTMDIYFYYGNPAATNGQFAPNDVFIREISNLNAMWKMDESSWTNNCSTDALVDSSGNSNVGDSCDNGIGPTTPVTGKFGNGVELTGLVSNQVGFYVNPSSGITDNETFSVAFWVKTSDTTQTSTVMYNSYTGPLEVVQEDGSGGNGSKLVAIYGGTRISSTYTFSETTTWHHVVVTRSAVDDTLRFYVDGATAGTSTSGTPSTAAAYGSIGMKYGGGNRSFVGFMDEVSVFGKQLSASEVSDLYTYYGYATTNYGDTSFVMNRVGTSEPTVGSLASEESGPGPIGYWKMDEGTDNTCTGGTNDICNSMGNNDINGASSGPTWQSEDLCLSGKCLYFDGSNDYIEVADNNVLDFGSSGFTVSTWIRTSNTASQYILEKDTSGCTNASWLLSTGTGTAGAAYGIIGSTSSSCDAETLDGGTTSLADNKWHHISLVRNAGGTNYIYVDGKVYDSIADPGGSTTNAQKLTFGAHNNDSDTRSGYFKGFMDETKIYNYARTADQIKTDYASRGVSEGTSAVLGANTVNMRSLSEGLAGYWKLNESSGDAIDYSGNGTTLTDTNTVARVAGKFANAGDFESGSTEYLYAADNANLSITGNLTVAAWVNRESSTNQYFLNKSDNLGRDSYLFSILADKLTLTLVDSNDVSSTTTSSASLSTGTWYHVAGVYDQSTRTVRLYINGQLADSTTTGTVPSSLEDNDGRFHLGVTGSSGTPVGYYDGVLDEARIYNRILSDSEISILYNWVPSPVGYWKLDENTGTSAYDSSSNGSTGTLTSGPAWALGKFGSGVDFDGSDDYIDAQSPTTLDDLPMISIGAWINPDTVGENSVGRIISKQDSSFENGWQFYIASSTTIGFLVDYTTVGETLLCTSSGVTISLDTLQHVAVTWDGSGNCTGVKFYINGVSTTVSADSIASARTSDASNNLYIGNSTGTARTFDGLIDDVRLYNYVRSSKQVVEDMNAGHPAAGSPVSSMAAYWAFDEQKGQTVNSKGHTSGLGGTLGTDSSTASDDPVWNIANSSNCKMNGCLDFDGTNDYAETTDSLDTQLTTSTSTFTLSAWVYPDSLSTGQAIVGKYGDGGCTAAEDQRQWLFYFTSTDKPTVVLNDALNGTGNEPLVAANTSVSNSTWTHLAATIDVGNDKVIIYINGKKDIESTITLTDIADGTNPITIGAYCSNGSAGRFNGKIDEVKVYTGLLTADEIKMDYNAGSAITLGGVLGTQDAEGFGGNAPTGWYSMDENTNNSCTGGTNDVCDISGEPEDGAITGATWAPGKFGSGVAFDGTDDKIQVTDDSDIDFGLIDFTLTAWIKNDGNDDDFILFKRAGTGDDLGYTLYIGASGRIRYQIGDDTNLVSSTPGTTDVSDNRWHFVVMTTDRTNDIGRIFIDGVQEGSNIDISSVTGTLANTADLYFGIDSSNNSDFTGVMDQVKFYQYIRTASQLAYDYNRGAPLAHYKLDECQGTTAYNSAPTGTGLAAGNNGTITPGAGGNTSAGTCGSGTGTEMWNDGTTGKRNGSLGFDGTDDYVTIADSAQLDISGGITISAWVKLGALGSYQQIVVKDKDTATVDRGYALYIRDTNKPTLFIPQDTSAATYIDAIGNTSLTTGTWYHITGVFSPSSHASVYINGVRDGHYTSSIPTGIAINTQAVGIGARISGSAQPLTGQIDDVRIYNYPLSEAQIKQVYNSGATFFGPSTGNP